MVEISDSTAGESPLVPNRTMQRMYEGMVQSRLLLDFIRTRRPKVDAPDLRGQEACRASALIDLGPNDFISDRSGRTASAFLHGADLRNFVTTPKRKGFHNQQKVIEQKGVTGLLPYVEDTADRLQLALGVGLAARQTRLANVVIVFVDPVEAKPSLWHKNLQFAALEQLPILFMALPSPFRKAVGASRLERPFKLSERSTSLGVPGIPVDASDAVALFRVAQESIGRARSGGGPALIECVPFKAPDNAARGKTAKAKLSTMNACVDPILAMEEMLLRRRVCGQDWLTNVGPAFQARLDAL